MGPLAVVPGDVEGHFPAEVGESVGDEEQTPGALVLEGPDAPFDHRQASVLANRTESMLDPVVPASATEPSCGELIALV